VTLNGKTISKNTEQNLILALASYWQRFLRFKLEKLRQKSSQNRGVRSDNTNIIISVTDRLERDLTKRFDKLEIDWFIIQKQLVA
jgi:hypothetical protein